MSIPRCIHQIWIGPKQVPKEWAKSWQEKNPSLCYILWNEKKINEFGLKNRNKYDYFVKKKIYHGAADIVRVEILERFGGIYLDIDSLCLESIENEFFMKKDFFAVMENEDRIANGVIGSIKEHPILKKYIKKIKEKRVIKPPHKTIGGTIFTDCIKEYGNDDKIEILPTCSFYPKDHWRRKAKVIGKIYAKQFWATTNNLYKE